MESKIALTDLQFLWDTCEIQCLNKMQYCLPLQALDPIRFEVFLIFEILQIFCKMALCESHCLVCGL